ncbi:MAG: hypothetical protein ABI205_08230 [Gemmatimonadaceae bacterium]
MSGSRAVSALAAAFIAVFAATAATAATAANAQSVRVADSLLQAGALVRAESIYYAAVRARPHDPIARWALGRYLVSRGAPRVGATLFEESLKFGGEPAIVGRDLAAAYLSMGDYAHLATLASATPDERQRAKFLAAHASRVVAPESSLVAVFQPAGDSATIGRVMIRVNGHTLDAAVSARVQGIVIADTSIVARSLHAFGAPRGQTGRSSVLAAADSVAIGRLTMISVPVVIDRLERRAGATIGLDVLARFAPTFDPLAQRITLHAGGTVPRIDGQRFEMLMTPTDVRVARAGGWSSVSRAPVEQLLRTHRWTLDTRRGQLVVE